MGSVAPLPRSRENAAPSIFSLKGCQIVAGGRSVAQTTGNEANRFARTLEGANVPATLSEWKIIFVCRPVVCTTLQPFRLGPARYREVVLTSWDRTLDQGQALELHH